MTTRTILVCLMMLARAAAQQPAYQEEKGWKHICDRAKAQAIVPPHLVSPLNPAALAHCDETALYYGFGEKPNYAAALQCGWYEREHPSQSDSNLLSGPGVLTMLYANGLGVPHDYDIAIHFACEQGFAAEAEMALRVGHLEYLRDAKKADSSFDLCDDITSGLSQGWCARTVFRAADAKREKKIAVIAQSLTPAQREKFESLRTAQNSFEDARTKNEVDLSGTARAAFAFEEQGKLRDQFLINLERFERATIPRASDADLSTLDGQLNIVYQKIQHAPPSTWQFGTVKPDGIRRTEQAWLKMADAWIAFEQAVHPELSETRIRAQLIRLRLHQLRSLLPNT